MVYQEEIGINVIGIYDKTICVLYWFELGSQLIMPICQATFELYNLFDVAFGKSVAQLEVEQRYFSLRAYCCASVAI